MKEFSKNTRLTNIEKFKTQKFDILIIGGGITGAGVARDAAQRGLNVALIEARDFASGTSSRSSKLIHGGIRYLENMEFHLVFEALSERAKLFSMAPHMVHPLRFLLPLYEGGRVGMLKMGLGMWLYDALALFRTPKLHERLSKKKTAERLPILQSQNLLGSYEYSDAYMDDDRLVFETLRSANQLGATCANYVKAIGDKMENGQVVAVEVQDQITQEKFLIQASHVVSSVGPWTDQVGEMLLPKWKKILRPTKGVHLTFEKKRFPLSRAVVMAAESRIVFGIPRHEMVIVGTTDTDFRESPENVSTTEEDVRYLLGVVNRYFPGVKIEAKDIVASYAGVRPLVQDDSDSEGKTSREHTVFTTQGVTFVAGGKYTTYRLMSEQIVDEVLSHLPEHISVRAGSCQTDEPLNPMANELSLLEEPALRERLKSSTRLSAQEVDWLVDRHSLEAQDIVKKYSHLGGYWEMELAHAFEASLCLNLVDFYTRRVPLFLADREHGLTLLPKLAGVWKTLRGLTEEETQLEVSAVKKYVEKELAWKKAF